MNTTNQIYNLTNLQEKINSEMAILIYFNTLSCNVGEALEPKVKTLLSKHFPKMGMYTVDINFSKEIAANFSAFVEPTILVFFDGKETIRKSRNIGIQELEAAIKRPYKLIFD
jgi:thioredoxin-like negative regulator of GroEL